MLLLLTLLIAWAIADDNTEYLRWADRQEVVAHPEPDYRFQAEIHDRMAELVRERPGVVRPFVAGRTVEGRPIWAFRVRDPMRPAKANMLVFGGIHALEWVGVEVAASFLEESVLHPPPGVELVVIPILNVDRRMDVEADLLAGKRVYRRANANGVDLNRDFAVNRDSDAIWRVFIPDRYYVSPAPLSQPETQAIDRLAAAERFDAAISLHCWGGYLYHPWAGAWKRPDDWRAFVELGNAMQAAQDARPYRVHQLSHWAFFFRALGAELDHLYGQYGTYAFLIEMTRSGIEPLDPKTWRDPFRFYNPVDPAPHVKQGVQAARALAWRLAWEGAP